MWKWKESRLWVGSMQLSTQMSNYNFTPENYIMLTNVTTILKKFKNKIIVKLKEIYKGL